jgi:hypothetical protein
MQHINVTHFSFVDMLAETASCRNAREDYVHKTQSGPTFFRTQRKQELYALSCPLLAANINSWPTKHNVVPQKELEPDRKSFFSAAAAGCNGQHSFPVRSRSQSSRHHNMSVRIK